MSRARGSSVFAKGVALFAVSLALAGCVTHAPPYEQRVHVVRKGETLYKIAWQYGIDQRDLARWNKIKDPDVIEVGQRLRLTPPSARAASTSKPTRSPKPAASGSAAASKRAGAGASKPPSAPAPAASTPPPPDLPAPTWAWPADGAVVVRFGSKEGIATGIGIGGRAGEPVHAAAAGRVVYAGNGLIGYGQLVIIKHNDTYLTAYGYNSQLLVSQGQDVARGQQIAAMGQGPERQPRLHFEIRRNGVPIDPLQFFPGR